MQSMTLPPHEDAACRVRERRTERFRTAVLAAALAVPPAFAQTQAPNAVGPETPPADPVNGYAEMLRPARRPGSKAAPVIQNQPYAPISRQNDDGRVPEIEMFVGESRVFPAPGVARIAVGNGALLTAAALDGKEVILFANGVGTSSLFIWNGDGRYQRVKISIVPGDTTRHAREIAAFLTTIPKARASVIGANIIVEGDDLSDEDQAKIKLLAERYPQIINFTNRLGWEQMVAMDVKVVEFPVSELREMGFKWTPTGGAAIAGIWGPGRRGNDGPYQVNIITGSNNPTPVTGRDGLPPTIPRNLNAFALMNLGLNAQLSMLAQEGKATVLAEPQLSARNGSPAKFLVGGEFPYSVVTRDGVSILFKPYGIKLEITPRVDRNGVIRAAIVTEVSSIDSSISTVGGPALLTRRTETEFNVREGESMVLSGLLQRESSTSVDKVPVLGDIPVLGALFRSKRYQNKETELVVFVTPTLVDARSAGNVDRIRRTTERLEERLGPKPYLTDPLQPGVSYERPDAVAGAPASPPGSLVPPAVASVPIAPTSGPAPAGAGSYAAEVQPPGGSRLTVTADAAAMRAAPSEASALLLQLHRGATVRLGEADPQPPGTGAWRNVVVGALAGWVPSSAVRPLGASIAAAHASNETGQSSASDLPVLAPLAPAVPGALTLPPSAGPALPRSYRVGLQGLALRLTPDINSAIVMRLREGSTVLALPEPPRGAWTAVQTGPGADERRGWVATEWLQSMPAQ